MFLLSFSRKKGFGQNLFQTVANSGIYRKIILHIFTFYNTRAHGYTPTFIPAPTPTLNPARITDIRTGKTFF